MPTSQNVELAPAMDEHTGLLEQQKLKALDHSAATKSADTGSNVEWRAVTAFVLALVCCGCANSITLFPMFAPGFQHDLGYSLFQINTISIASSLGMYLPVPILGMIADRMGPGNLGLISMFLFSPSYLVAAHISQLTPEQAVPYFHVLVAAFACIGTASSALYFCAVITCAKTLTRSPGLAISAPVALYGLGSLWQSQVVQSYFFDDTGNIILSPTFQFFTVLYVITGVVSYIGSSVIGRITGTNNAHSRTSIDPIETAPVVTNDNDNNAVHLKTPTGEGSYGSTAEPENQPIYKDHSSVASFLQDRTVWVFFAALVLISGPLEMYLNNMGMILNTIPQGPAVATNVSVFSAFSTLSRLSVGLISDLVKKKVSRPTILVFILLFTSLLNFLMASGIFTLIDHGSLFFLSSSGIGFAYGAVYTLFPTIVACTWGVENLGTHWGIFITAPALGSTAFGSLFASIYDAASSTVSNLLPGGGGSGDLMKTCTGRACYEVTFLLTGTSVLVSALMVALVYLFAWRPRRTLV